MLDYVEECSLLVPIILNVNPIFITMVDTGLTRRTRQCHCANPRKVDRRQQGVKFRCLRISSDNISSINLYCLPVNLHSGLIHVEVNGSKILQKKFIEMLLLF